MPSTYSANLRLELIAAGEQANTWGNTTNTNLGTLLENAITGYVSLTTMGDADYTLIALNGANDQARQMYINVPASASLSATRSIIAPSVPKQYIISNNSSGGQSVRIKTASSTTTCLIPNGQTKLVVCDGTNFIEGVTAANSLLLAANPTLALQAATKQYVDAADALKLNLTGGTLTGALNLPASAPTGNNATSYDYVNTNYLYKAAGGPTQTMNPYLRLNYTPTNAADAVHKAYVDAQIATVTGGYLPLTGGTLTGALTLSGAPTTNLQAATKLYVDNIAAAAASTYLPLTGGTLTGALTLAGAPVSNLQAATKLYVDSNTSNKQPLDGDLTAIAALTGGAGFLKKTGFETWALDTNTYITGNQTITLSGAVTGSGTTSITTTLADSPVVAGSYTNANITVNAKGIVTSASSGSAFALPTATDTTLGGVKVNGNTVSISGGTLFLNSTNVNNALGYTACSVDGSNATGVWGIDTSGSADYLQYGGSYYTANQFYLASNPNNYLPNNGVGANTSAGPWNIDILGSAGQLGGYTAAQFVLDSELTTILTNYPSVTGVGASGSWGINITQNAATATAPQGGGSFITTSNIATQTVATAGNANNLGGSPAANYLLKTDASTIYLSKTDASTTYVTKTGGGATGTGWAISITGSSATCTGNAATATAPQGGGSFITSSNIGSQNVNSATYLGSYTSSGFVRNDGTNGNIVGSGDVYLDVKSTSNTYFGRQFGIRIGSVYSLSAGANMPYIASYSPSTYYAPIIFGQYIGTTYTGRANIDQNGSFGVNNLANGSGASVQADPNGYLYVTSDANRKTFDGYIEAALPTIMQLTPKYFTWKAYKDYPLIGGGRQLGFFAQEVNAIIPEAAATPPEDNPDAWGINDRALIAMLVKAVQELKAEVDALRGA